MRDAGDGTGNLSASGGLPVPGKRDYGFSQAHRLVRGSDFQRVFSTGRRKAGRHVVLWVVEGPSEIPRAGVVASKRTFRRAVDRARAKRLLREAFRLNRDALTPHVDCVLVARRAILQVNRPEVERDLLHVARRCRVLREEG